MRRAIGTAPASRNFRSCSRPACACSPACTLSASISRRHRCRGSCLPCSPCSGTACRRRPCSPARRWRRPGQAARPVTMVDGFAMLDRLWPASLVRALRSSIVSLGLFSGGSSDLDFSNSLPISLIRPGIFVARRRAKAAARRGCGSRSTAGRASAAARPAASRSQAPPAQQGCREHRAIARCAPNGPNMARAVA